MKTIAAIIGVTCLGICAMLKGLDGAVFWPAIVAVSGLGGFALKRKIDGKKE